MTIDLYDAFITPMAEMLGNMAAWLDKAEASGADTAKLMQARLAPDMHPLPKQFQVASDMAKNAAARMSGVEAPSMPDTETDFAQLKARMSKTVEFLKGVDRAAVAAAGDKAIELSFPSGAFGFRGGEYLSSYVTPNFYFHATTAYAILRANGVPLGKFDFLAHAARFSKQAA